MLTDATADLAFALLLALARRLPEGERDVREGQWVTFEPDRNLGAEVTGATLGIVGFGRIGQAVARRAEGFGMEILHTGDVDRSRSCSSARTSSRSTARSRRRRAT